MRRAKSSIIYIRRMILRLRGVRPNSRYILRKNENDKSKTNEMSIRDRTSG